MIPLTRAIDVLLKTVAAIFLIVVAGFVFDILARWGKNVQERRTHEERTTALSHNLQLGKRDVAIMALAMLALVVTVVAYQLPDQQFRNVTRVGGGTVLVSSVAGALFFVKVNYLRVYSLLEISFALTLAARTMWRLGDEIDPMEMLEIMTAA